MLALVAGCDKAKEFVRAGQPDGPPLIAPGEALDLSAKPDILFQVFGETGDPRMIPIAAIQGGKLRRIVLTQAGWRQFDAMYLRHGRSYTVYQDGRINGTADVKQGMWEKQGEPTYSLPGCSTLTPLATVSYTGRSKTNFTLEFLASTARLGASDGTPTGARAAGAAAAPVMSVAEGAREGRRAAAEAAKEAGISQQSLDSLDYHAVAVQTAPGRAPTIIASFIDPSAENPASTAVETQHLLVVADRDQSGTYHPTYTHVADGPLRRAAFRRYFDHLDVTGDGVDEIVLEGWQFGGDTFLSILSFENGKWTEAFRTRPNWCLDEKPRGT